MSGNQGLETMSKYFFSLKIRPLWPCQKALFSENEVSKSYHFNGKIQNLRVSKINPNPKDGWTDL